MTPEDLNSLMQIIADRTGLSQSVFIALALIGLVGWICWRTQSTHIILSRIWRIFVGPKAFSDEDVARFAEKRDNLIAFRFISGVCARSLPVAKTLILWSEKHNEDVEAIQTCGKLFDLEACRLLEEKFPKTWKWIVLNIAIAMIGFFMTIAVAGWITDRAILRFNESKTWFLLSDTTATSFWGNDRVTKENCAELSRKPIVTSKFSNEETQIICKALESPDIKTDINGIVAQQRIACGVMIAYLLFFAWQSVASLRSWSAAKSMKRRLDGLRERVGVIECQAEVLSKTLVSENGALCDDRSS